MLRALTVFLTIILLSPSLFSQERLILSPDGKIIKHKGDLRTLEARSVKEKIGQEKLIPIGTSRVPGSVSGTGTIDTLRYELDMDTNFGMFGQDWMIQWFIAPADLNIHQVGFSVYANAGAQQVEVKVVKCNWTADEFFNAGVTHWGYYQAAGNGYNDATAFFSNPDKTGDWVWSPSTPPATEPFGEDLWSDGGTGFPLEGVPQDEGSYQWVDLSILGYPALLAGEIFGIAVKNTATDPSQADDNFRVGMWSSSANTFPGWKYYAQYRSTPGVDYGWWSREYVWDFIAEVELTGDRGPVINSFTEVPSGLATGPFTIDANITDDNPGDPSGAGVASAVLHYSVDDGTTWNDVNMTGTEPDFSAEIPAQAPGTTVMYYITTADVNALSTESSIWSFYVFQAVYNTLIVFNGFTAPEGYPQSYYFGSGDWPNSYDTRAFDHDVWSYGPLSAELVNNYVNILEICTDGPNDLNSDVIRAWLEADPTHNYALFGDEWLGAQTGWVNTAYAAGTFHFDILGVNQDYNDVNYAAAGDEQLPRPVYPQEGSDLGGPTFTLYSQVTADSGWTAPMTYDPYYEVSVSNWLDGVDFEADVVVDMQALAIDGTTIYNIGGHRTLPAGNKIAFFAFDPLSLSSDTENGVEYFWYGFMDTSPANQVLNWFGVSDDVREVGGNVPQEFAISQNYPNPFNPTTTIDFAVPKSSLVTLKVYDILGKEITTLINKDMNSGNYKVNFDASGLASGMYIYTITAGDFTSSKKMVLLK